MTEKSDDDGAEMDAAQREELELHLAMLGASGVAICDCKAVTFYVALQLNAAGDNHIVALICPACKKDLRVPFFHDASAGSA